jgi:uncharacterized membrane protein YidH (DUF202 family)
MQSSHWFLNRGIKKLKRNMKMRRIIDVKSQDEIIDSIKKRPTDMLALARTIMAGERTFLGYVRTSVGFLAGGIGIVMYLKNPFLIIIGVLLILTSIAFLINGVLNYRRMRMLFMRAYETLSPSNFNAGGDIPEENSL